MSGEEKPRGGKRIRAYRVSADRLKALRAARGWSQQEAADYAGVSGRLIGKAETGRPIELKSVALLAALYSTPGQPLAPQDLLADPAEAANSLAAVRHEALIQRWIDGVWNHGRLEAIDELAAPDCVFHAGGAASRGRAQIRRRAAALRAAIGDFEMQLVQVLVEGEWVAGRWRIRLKQPARGAGSTTQRPRGAIEGSTWWRIASGQFNEIWRFEVAHRRL